MHGTAHLRANSQATLLADELASRTHYVRHAGRLIIPGAAGVLEADNLVLFIPEEDDPDELQVMVSAEPLDEGAATARWRAYHGEPRLAGWASLAIDGARFRGQVIDHDPLGAISPIAAAEPALCRLLNSDRAKLAAACKRLAGVAPQDPVAVGADDQGIDIRARFGIIRLPFPAPARTEDDARASIAALLGTAS